MLGFSALSETPLGEAVTSSEATAYITGGSQSTFSLGTLTFIAKASFTLPAATATISPTTIPLIQGIGRITVTGVTGTGAVNLPAGNAQAKGNITLSGATGTSAVSATTGQGKANQVPTGVSGTFASGIDFDAEANITLNSASARLDLTVNSFEDEDAQGSLTLTGVSATMTAAVNTDSALNGGIYSNNIVYLNTDFSRERCVNIVPYTNYTVYIQKVSNY